MRSSPRSSCTATPSCAESRSSSAAARRAVGWCRPPTTRRAGTACDRRCRAPRPGAVARRRCSCAPTTASTATGRGGCGSSCEGMAPVVEQVGIDEGYLVLPDGDPREQAALIQLAVRRADAALVLARRRDLQGRRARSRRTCASPAASPWSSPATKPSSSRRCTCAGCPASAPRPRRGSPRARHHDDRRAGVALRRTPGRAPARARLGIDLRLRACGVDDRAGRRRAGRGGVDLERGDVRSRRHRPGRAARRCCATWPTGLAESLHKRGWAARTVTTKLRYPDFSIVTRSHSFAVGHRRRRRDRRPRLRAARPRADRPTRCDPAVGRGRVRHSSVTSSSRSLLLARWHTRRADGGALFEMLVRGAVLAVGERRALARLSLARGCPAG